jgi:hypothetical protein
MKFHPSPMDGTVGVFRFQTFFPFFVGHSHGAVNFGIMDDQPSIEYPHQNGHTDKRPRYFDQGKPFSVVTCNGHDYCSALASRSAPRVICIRRSSNLSAFLFSPLT